MERNEKITEVFEIVREMEKEYNSKENRTIENIEACYEDDYMLSMWESEKEDWGSFEDFLIDVIEQNLEMEQHKNMIEKLIEEDN